MCRHQWIIAIKKYMYCTKCHALGENVYDKKIVKLQSDLLKRLINKERLNLGLKELEW